MTPILASGSFKSSSLYREDRRDGRGKTAMLKLDTSTQKCLTGNGKLYSLDSYPLALSLHIIHVSSVLNEVLTGLK